ncbi:hypothetical protein KSS87_004787 [Heliosperma pusillum]|nr:hypothetical protein KSS87_004787 [Heliosperma pusillum]
MEDDLLSISSALFNIISENMGSSVSSLPENIESSVSSLPEDLPDRTFLPSALVNMFPDFTRTDKFLSTRDLFRLLDMQAVYESNQGKLLAYSGGRFTLVDRIGNGFIPEHALFGAPYSSLVHTVGVEARRLFRRFHRKPRADRVLGELSEELSKYIWPLQGAVHVQFRSPVAYLPAHFPPVGELKIVFSNILNVAGGEYCLAACEDGTVKWLRESKCVNRNHIWTVHLFDPPSNGEEVHLSERLRRRGSNVENELVINNYIGGNVNNGSGMNIGPVYVNIG